MGVRNCAELGENLKTIVKALCANQKLLKYLYYSDKDPLNHPDLDQIVIQKEIMNKLIRIIPKVGPKETAQSVLVIRVANGRKLSENKEFKLISLVVEIFVPLTQWIIKSDNLRPFLILGEIQKSLDGKTINGLGKLEGGNFDLNFITDEIVSYEMLFNITAYD